METPEKPIRVLEPPEAKNRIEIYSDHAKVYLTRGKVALIDVEDVEKVRGYRWGFVKRNKGYASTSLQGARCMHCNAKEVVTVAMHRAILGDVRGLVIDHVNHDGLDNRRENLRHATYSENALNQRKQKRVTLSKYKGVSFNRRTVKWFAYVRDPVKKDIRGNGASRHLGTFTDEVEAARAYDRAALELYGEFACTNVSLGLLPPPKDDKHSA